LIGDAHERKAFHGFRFLALHARERFISFLTTSESTQVSPLNSAGGEAPCASEIGSKDRPFSLAWRAWSQSTTVPPTRDPSAVDGRNAAVEWTAVALSRA